MQCSSGMGRMVLFRQQHCLFCLSDSSSFRWRKLPLPHSNSGRAACRRTPWPRMQGWDYAPRLMLVVCPLGYSDQSKHQFNPRALAQIQWFTLRVYTWTPGERALFPSWSLNRDDVNLELLIGIPRTIFCKTRGGSSVQWERRRITYREKYAWKKEEEITERQQGRWRGQREKTSLQRKAQARDTEKETWHLQARIWN